LSEEESQIEDELNNKTAEQFRVLEYSLIILFVLAGAAFLMSASDLVSIFLAIELQSYRLYIISTLYLNWKKKKKKG
jgi:NADH-ubiquinone oxidoreductase chain 2